MRKLYFLFFLGLLVTKAKAIDYYSVAAATDANALASWNTDPGGAGAAPAIFTGAGDVFIVQTGHSLTTSANWIVTAGAGSALRIQTGGALTANHVITLAAAATFQLDNGSTYTQSVATINMPATIFAGTEVFAANSNFIYTANPSTVAAPASPGYGNLTINNTTASIAFGWGGNISQVQGNFTVISTGNTAAIEQRLSNTALTLNVGGAFTVQGGTFAFSGAGGNVTMNAASFSQTGGTLNLGGGSGNGLLTVTGIFNQTGGTITETSSSTASGVNFIGSVLQTVTMNGATTNSISFGISNPVGIDLSGTMTIDDGGSLIIATASSNPVQGSGTISYTGALTSATTMANLRFQTLALTTFTSGAQTVTDKLWPAVNGPNAVFIDNTTTAPGNRVTSALTGDRVLVGGGSSLNQLTITNGVFDIANSSITMAQNAVLSVSSPSNTKMIATSGNGYLKMYMAAGQFTSLTFPVGDVETNPDYAEVFFTYSTAASAASFLGVRVRNTIIPADAPGTDYAPRHWTFTQETVAGGLPSGISFVSAPAYTHKIDCKGPVSEVVGTGTNTRLFKNVAGVYTQLNSGYSTLTGTYTTGNFNTGTFPAVSETGVNGYIYAPRTYLGQQTYTWNGSVSNDYQVAANWTPSRTAFDVADILQFSSTPSGAITNIPLETIGRLLINGGAQVILNNTNALTTGGGTATGAVECLNISATSRLTHTGSASITLAGPSTASTRTATIDGALDIAGSGNMIIAGTNSPVVTFSSTGVLNILAAATGGLTNSASPQANFLIFQNGAVHNHLRNGGTVQLSGTYNAGSTVNAGTSASRLTTAPTMSFPVSFGGNFNYYANNANTFQSISAATGGTTVDGSFVIDNSSLAGIVTISGSSANIWTLNGQVTLNATVRLSTGTTLGAAPVYNFSRATAPSLNVAGGSLSQIPTTGTTAAFTTVNITNGATFDNGTALAANSNTGGVTSGDFTVNINGGDLTFGSGTSFAGSLSTSASATATPKLNLVFAGTANQNFTTQATTTGRTQIRLNKASGNVLLSGNFTTNTIDLTSGHLILGSGNLTLNRVGSNATIAGVIQNATSAKFIVTNGTGSLIRNQVGTPSGPFTFPVGSATGSYSPLTITNVSNYNWSVNAASGVNPLPAAPQNTDKSVLRTWTITPSVNPPATATDLLFEWNEANTGITGPLYSNTENVQVWRYNGSFWQPRSNAGAIGGTPGGVRTFSVNSGANLSFSPFAISNVSGPLPVRIVSFNAYKRSGFNLLSFEAECSTDYGIFEIQRGSDARSFATIEKFTATQERCRSPFDVRDENFPNSKNYYRLKMTDANGVITFSNIVMVLNAGGFFEILHVQPTVTTSNAVVSVSAGSRQNIQLLISSVDGRVMVKRTVTVAEGTNQVPLDVTLLPAGIYNVQLLNSEGVSATVRFIKQ